MSILCLAAVPAMASLAPATARGTGAMGAMGASGARERHFILTYTAVIDPLPAGAQKVEIWLPYPQSDRYQDITAQKIDSPFPARVEQDPVTGNAMLHAVVANPPAGQPIAISMSFDVQRYEHVHRYSAETAGTGTAGDEPPTALARWLQPDRLVPLDARIRDLSRQVVAGKQTAAERARAIYDYVVSTMKYDKSGTGWGNGDIHWACDAKRGNCTDFHALFIGLSRAAGIPARFEIGLPLPAAEHEGDIPGYHCWAEFYLKGFGWVPVDASEASRHPEQRDYFFGAHDENRVQFTTGRDLVLQPRQAGAPLNYFIYPYVEIDGKPFSEVKKSFRFKDVQPAAAPAATSR
jgi:transglutaminase-like putative cysteine protease